MKPIKGLIRRTLWLGAIGIAVMLLGLMPRSKAQEQQATQSRLDPAAKAQIAATIGHEEPAYHFAAQPGGFRMENARHGLSAEFTPSGAELRLGSNHWGMSLRGYGYGNAVLDTSKVAPRASANRLEYTRDGLTEWYVNGPVGLEQGFTLMYAPAKSNGQPLTFAFALSGDLTASVDLGARGLTLTKNGAAILRYGGLIATDANGRDLPAWLEVANHEMRMYVDDRDAQYPVTVDPVMQVNKLSTAISCVIGGHCDDGEAGDEFGSAVAVSADGSTIVVGVPDKLTGTTYTGAAYVFLKSPVQLGGWGGAIYYACKLITIEGYSGNLGASVAISSNGGIIVLGSPGEDLGVGAVYVYAKSSGWSGTHTESARLSPVALYGNARFGESVAITADGSTIMAGSPGASLAYAFAEPSGGWITSHETAVLSVGGYTSASQFGQSVSISGTANNSTLAVGAPVGGPVANGQGAVYIFLHTGNWSSPMTQPAAMLTASDTQGSRLGWSVSLSSDGSSVAASALGPIASGPGAIYVFLEPTSTICTSPGNCTVFPEWGNTTEKAKLTSSQVEVIGNSVSMSGDGSTIATGGTNSALIYVRPSTGWTSFTESGRVVGLDTLAGDTFGSSVSLNTTGALLVAGSPRATLGSKGQEGAAYIFNGTVSLPVASVSPATLTFGPQAYGTTSAPQSVTLTNTGSAPLNVTGVLAKYQIASTQNCLSATPLAPGASCTEQVTFTPTAIGPATALLNFTDDSNGMPGSIQQCIISVTGVSESTSTALASSINPSSFGQAVTFTATVMSSGGAPTGTVNFMDGASLLGTGTLSGGSASYTTNGFYPGTHSIVASYVPANSDFTASASSALVQTVNLATSTTTLVSSVNPSYVTQKVTFTASVASQFGGAVSGNITFKQGTAILCSVMSLSGGSASCSPNPPYATAGTYSITAVYSGDSNNIGSTSAALKQTVKALPAATTTTLISSGSPAFINQPITFTAAITSTFGSITNGDTVNFFDGATQIGTGTTAGGMATFTTSSLSAKIHTIKATFVGDATYAASSGTFSQSVTLYPTTTSLSSSMSSSTYGQAVILTATVTSTAPGGATGTVKFLNGTTSLGTATLSGGIATLSTKTMPAGALTITANYLTDGVSAASSGTTPQTVSQATTTTSVVSSLNPANAGQSVKFTVTVASPTTTPTGSVIFMDGTTTLATVTLASGKAAYTTTTLASGSHNITVVYSGTANIIGSTSPVLVQTVN